MKIEKNLKYGAFTWDDETKLFEVFIINRDTGKQRNLTLNKVYAFAFLLFIIRMAQRNWFRMKKITIKTKEGGYDSKESSAELTVTFVGPVDSKKANEYVKSRLDHLVSDTDDDPDWIKNEGYLKKK